MNEEEIISTIALTQITGLGPIGIRRLIGTIGSASDIFRRKRELPHLVPGFPEKIIKSLDNSEIFSIAEKELAFACKNKISCLTITDEMYPNRLLECDDAPAILFSKGEMKLNSQRIISMIGTRNATDYGKQLCMRFLSELKESYPDILIVSGLAYGIDILSHRAALDNGLSTIGVLAHGLDRIYPAAHRKTAIEMLNNGGLLTEYLSGTNPDRQNFVRRNRIVAGMCDATIVVQSATKGGALITAEIADSYHRDCFAFPGRPDDEFSQGCNKLIRENKATLIQCADDFIKSMCWEKKETKSAKKGPVQRQIFIDLDEDEAKIIQLLQQGDQQINMLVVKANIPIHQVSACLFELEMKGLIRVMAGGMYQLI